MTPAQSREKYVEVLGDEDGPNVDVIPSEVAEVLRREYAGQELQAVNFRRLLTHDGVLLADLRTTLERRGLDRSGNKAELIERAVAGEVRPSEVLGSLDTRTPSAPGMRFTASSRTAIAPAWSPSATLALSLGVAWEFRGVFVSGGSRGRILGETVLTGHRGITAGSRPRRRPV